MRSVVTVLAAAAALVSMAGVASAQQRECRPAMSATVTSQPTPEVGEAAAIALWTAKTAAEHYPVFSNWTNAQAKSVACERYTGALGFNVYRCTAQAIPCRIP
jgi:hypothetical protein